ncbi:ATP-dependent RNA helicase HrpA [Williamsia sp. CHRR-6]|uniref:ATP-dependent RNA helicase HrpA n=1 Tax=Williamsia sp. CHRR-6 TaxID=2835871 RepID=UPI001BD94C6C|nr:ATP-dependent RNA helicase HrpA [Williamsia sp. CHRR-6]MBT0567916.1 ATP-dependent RNA helicase HrpA [Williamsia sp. CHRR-6]
MAHPPITDHTPEPVDRGHEPAVIDWTEVSIADEFRLKRRRRAARTDTDRNRFAGALQAARTRTARRRAAVPRLDYPADLPISLARNEISDALRDRQVVVVAGETGSGKTTQLPKICLELGRGVRGMIGHTQPRRIAARSVAARIAEETHTELGETVGFAVRFDDRTRDDTLVKVMTDGILLREIGRDPMLRAYDTIIVDEAHERSLTIDFILGYLKQLLPRRPDLLVIITSATIDPGRFADHFATDDRPVPIISVSGRTYPVEVRYRPRESADPDDDHEDLDQIDAISRAVDELCRAGPGDILVFLATEREIRDTADALGSLRDRGIDILPLFSRLSTADQHKVFATSDRRRIVLSTNIAETSLTVPGIRFVIDVGTARISRYSVRTKVQRLPVEPISQASARQRAGRCGRVADGICIRLYSEDDFAARPEFTEPEILRTNLASVILTMTALGLGDIDAFPFVEPPDPRAVRDGVALLEELGAIDGRGADRNLTPVGRDLSDLPVDPRWARMLVAARENGALAEVLVIVSALSLPDVRERPVEHRQAADTAHARFHVPGSDFLSIVMLWNHLQQARTEMSGNQFRRQCEREFLHWLRIREWRELHQQLSRIVADKGWTPNTEPTSATSVHQSLLAGLLGHIGVRDGDSREFQGARGTRFVVFPGSPLAGKPPRFVMAAEVVETSRLFARTVASIEPEWAEKLAGPLVKRSYSEPHWSSKRASAMAYERVTLYGVPLVARRAVPYGRIDAEESRELFIRHALVEGDWRTPHAFFTRNQTVLDEARELETRSRRGDLVVDDEKLFEFYETRIGAEVVSGAHFDTWWKRTRKKQPTLLDLSIADISDTTTVASGDFPDHWQQGEARLPLVYQFTPGSEHDGVTVCIPLPLLPRIRPSGFDWLVPGLRDELAVALVRTLPKSVRRQLGPAADVAVRALAALTPRSEPLTSGLARELTRQTGVVVGADDFDQTRLPDHLRMAFAATDADGSVLATAPTLAELTAALRPAARGEPTRTTGGTRGRSSTHTTPAATPRAAPIVYTEWSAAGIGTLDESITETVAGQRVTSYPTLRATETGVVTDLATSAATARAQTHLAIRRLLELSIPPLKAGAVAELSVEQRIALSQSPYRDATALFADCMRAAIRDAVGDTGSVRTPEQFAALRAAVAQRARGDARSVLRSAAQALVWVAPIRAQLERLGAADATEDARDQLDHLIYDGFIAETAGVHLARLPAYLDGIERRLSRLPAAAATDRRGLEAVDRIVAEWNRAVARVTPDRRAVVNEQIHWMIEEMRISLFAEQVGTAYPASEKRTSAAIAALCR